MIMMVYYQRQSYIFNASLIVMYTKEWNGVQQLKLKYFSMGIQARIQKIFPGGPTLSKIDSVWRITVEVHKYEK